MTDLRRRLIRLRALAAYRADQFLSYPPAVQILVVVGATALVILFWALALRFLYPAADDVHSMADRLWWSVTLFSDGGTMAGSPPERRALALGVTFSGVLALSFLTGAFASKMSARIDDLKSGKSPVVERRHVLILGFDSKVTFLAREIARSGQRHAVVVMALEDKDKIEHALRPARRVPHNRARFIARTGDPRSETALLRVSADRTRSIIIVPPSALGDEETVHWALSTLLAVRRVVGSHYRGHIVVESRYAEAEDVLALATEPDVAGPGALRAEVVGSDDVVARVLAQSARQEGVYFALREMLSFVGSELYLERVPRELAGKTFDEAHELLTGGIAIGVRRSSGVIELAPAKGEGAPLARKDKLIVLMPRSRSYCLDGKFAALARRPSLEIGGGNERERVLVIGFNRTLERLIVELDEILADGSEIRVMCCPLRNPVKEALARVTPRLRHVKLTHDTRRPLDLVGAHDDELLATDAVVVLGCEDENDDNGDASALSTLLSLRHGMRKAGKEIQRVVTEVRDLRSAGHVSAGPRDLLVSSDVVAMLLAQSALAPDAAPVYREILSPEGHEIFLRPRSLYVGDREATFGDVMAAARERGEVALGLYPAEPRTRRPSSLRDVFERGELGDERESPVMLNPPRETPVAAAPRGFVVVLADAVRRRAVSLETPSPPAVEIPRVSKAAGS